MVLLLVENESVYGILPMFFLNVCALEMGCLENGLYPCETGCSKAPSEQEPFLAQNNLCSTFIFFMTKRLLNQRASYISQSTFSTFLVPNLAWERTQRALVICILKHTLAVSEPLRETSFNQANGSIEVPVRSIARGSSNSTFQRSH